MSADLVHTRRVSRVFRTEAEVVRAVDDVDMAATGGEFVGLFGHSGSGKTTLLNLLGGIDVPTSGAVVVAGVDVGAVSEDHRVRLRRETVGMVHQTDHLIEEFTAAENVALPSEARGVKTRQAMEEAVDLLGRVGLGSHTHRLPRQLSGGQRQRVGIARAMTGGRSILLADEPTGSLDSANAEAIFSLLRGLSDEGHLVIVASHDPLCRRFATRVIDLVDGRVKQEAAIC